MRKLQSSIEKFMFLAVVTVVAIGVSYFLYSSFYSTVSHMPIKSYMVQANFDNIYGNKTSIFILLKNKTDIGSNTLINEKITFSNGTSNTISVPFELQMSSVSGGGYLYYFTTSKFPTIANSSQAIKISNIYAISGNIIIESENRSVSYTAYYYTKASLANLPLYYLNMTASPLNAGILTPGNGYYYAGSKVAIGEKPNTGYAFAGWSGYGNGNYTGTNQTSVIIMNSNITEYARYTKLVKMYVNATYNGIPVYVNGVSNITTNGTIYLMAGSKYTISFPMYIPAYSGVRYALENLQDDCGISISPNSNSTSFVASYTNYNCKFVANYVEQYSLSINFNPSEGSATPSSGYYNVGTNIKITTTSNYGYTFGKVIGNGDGSYTGTDNPFYVTMNSPITENVVFLPVVFVYVKSSAKAVPYSFKSNYGVFYNGTTNSSFTAPAGSTLTLNGIIQVNWGERKITTLASSTCTSSGSSIPLPTTGGASCIIYINPPTIQYLFIVNEFLNGGSESNNLQYGSVYVYNGSQTIAMTSNQTWINAGTNVTFYATNDKAGYAFQGFSGTSDVLNGVAYSGVSGVDSNPGTPVGTNQQWTHSWWGPPPGSSTTYSNGEADYNLIESKFGGWVSTQGSTPADSFDCDAPQYIPISIVMNSPVIENANYYPTSNITSNTVAVNVNYQYYNVTEDSSSSGIVATSKSLISSGVQTIYVSNVVPYSNYSAGIGKEIVYYLTGSSSDYYDYSYPNSYYESQGNSYSVYNFTSQQLQYMPSEYTYVVNQVISNIEKQYPPELIQYNRSISYAHNLQLSFSVSGTQVYVHYSDLPSSTIYYYQTGSSSTEYWYNEGTNFFGYSNYDFSCN